MLLHVEIKLRTEEIVRHINGENGLHVIEMVLYSTNKFDGNVNRIEYDAVNQSNRKYRNSNLMAESKEWDIEG